MHNAGKHCTTPDSSDVDPVADRAVGFFVHLRSDLRLWYWRAGMENRCPLHDGRRRDRRLIAAIPGLIDLLSLPPEIRKTAIIHMTINLTIVALFAIDIWMRVSAGEAGAASNKPVWISLVAIVLLLVSGWFGGKMVYEAGVAVDTEQLRQRT